MGKFAWADYLLYVLVVKDKILVTQRKALVRLVEVATGQVKVDDQIALSENLALSMAAVREKVLTAVRPDSQAANRLTVGIAQFPNRSGTGRSDKLGVELQKALRKRLNQETWAVVLEREYPKVLLNELDLGRAGLVRDNAVETLPPADLVISGSTDDVGRVYEPDKPWEVTLDLSLRLRGHTSHVSQTFGSDAIEAAAEKIMQEIDRFRRQPASPTTVPEKELWRRQGLYLMPKARPGSGPGLNPNFPPTSELNQRELIRAWENVLLLDDHDPEAMTYLGVCLIGFDQARARYDQKKVGQWIAGSRLVERALSIQPVVQFAVQRAMGVLLCWGKKDSAALGHFDKAIAVMEAAYQRCRSPYRDSLNNIYRLRIEACEYLGLPEEAKKTAWAGTRHFRKLGRFDVDYQFYSPIGWLYEFCVTKAVEAGQEKEALELCDAYIAGATENWQRYDGWPQVCAKREELSARLTGKSLPGMGGLRLVMGPESLLGPGQRELVAMRMTAAAGKLWFVPLSKYNDNHDRRRILRRLRWT